MTGGIKQKGRFFECCHTAKEGPVRAHKNTTVVELPGTYSLSAYTLNDITARDILINGKPDVIVNIVTHRL